MLRILIAIVATTLVISTSEACVSCKTTRGNAAKHTRCHDLVGSKNLKGAAFTSEMGKCLENPDVYK